MRWLLVLLLAGCGTMVRSNVGPTINMDGKFGLEVGTDLTTHMIGTQQGTAPIGVRLQAHSIGDEHAAFVAFVAGDAMMPRFYGKDPTLPDDNGEFRSTRGYGGHISGALGRNTDHTIGVRAAAGFGHGIGRSRDGRTARFRIVGGELAWQGSFISDEDGYGWDNVANRYTGS